MKLFYPGCKLLAQLTVVFLITINFAYSQSSTPFSFTSIPYSDPDLLAPGRGAEQWHNGTQGINYPTETNPQESADAYYRFEWARLEGATQGSYTWGYFDGLINNAINNGQKFSFGIMTHFSDGGLVSYGGGTSSYPLYLHNLMQAEGTNSTDWLSTNGVWVPNWNSSNYLGRLRALHEALYNHIMTGSYTATGGPRQGQRVNYRDVIYCIDIRGYGNWGEWHSGQICNFNSYPTGRQPTTATFKKIIDHHIQVFDKWPLVMMVAGYDGGYTGISLFGVPAEVSYYALTARNAWGAVGFRRDQWGAKDGYLYNLLAGNNQTYNGSAPFKTYILDKYKYAPVTGEPMPASLDMSDLENQVNLYHATSIGNGNWGAQPTNTTVKANIRSGFKRTGYRIELTGGSAATTSSSFTVNLNWRNVGVAPTYENWRVTYELRNGSTVVWTGNSSFRPKLFLPSTNATIATDVFGRTGIPQGTYSLYVVVKDTTGYRSPLPLAITGRGNDGAYLLSNSVSIPAAGSNQVPVANAGSNQTITLPTNSTSLNGNASSDADGTIVGYQWQQVSGPSASVLSATNTASITVSTLEAGVYTYRLTVTDNGNGTATDTVTVTVNNAVVNQTPIADGGSNKTITLPTSSTTLSGSASADPDGTITSYGWQQESGPSASTLSSTNTVSITVSNLQAGTYTYRLTVTDNNGATDNVSVTVTVNNAPVNQTPIANAGANKAITLPINSISLSGSATDADGTIAGYQWQQVSGPSASTLSAINDANITVSNLQAGVYTYRLTVRDNADATGTDEVTVTVNNAPNQAPVANAGLNRTITLPTSSANLNGSGTDADGTIGGYLWKQMSGPSTSSLSSTNTASITVSTLLAGTYTYRLTVTDNDGSTDTDDVTVTVENAPPNQAPTANAGTNKSITLPTNSMTLSGSGSTDADGTVARYLWQQVSGPTTSTLSAANTANITVSNLEAGVYTYRLTVTDNDNSTDTDDVTVTVNNAPVNVVPNANAGANVSITLPISSTTLSGTGSADSDGAIASYQWQQLSGPSSSTFSSTNTSNITVSNLLAGVYTYRLTVTDNGGSTDTDDIIVTVENEPINQAPTANAGANKTINLPANSTSLNGGGSSDADGTITSYLWQQVSGPTTSSLSATNTASIIVSSLQAGVYTYRLTVTDNDNSTNTDDVTVTVNNVPVNEVPNANAGANVSITLPINSTSLSGAGSADPDGAIASYQWRQLSGPSSSTFSSTNTSNITVSNLLAGVYTYRLTVTDSDGSTDTDDIIVTVENEPINQAPTANAGANKAINLPTNSTSLNGAVSSDADGTIASYLWQQVSGPTTSSLSATNTANITVSNLQAGVYTYRLTVTDNDNSTDTDDVTVTVNNVPVNEVPNANAGANLKITLPINSTTLTGNGSTDTDGTIASYKWQQLSGPSVSTFSSTNASNITISNLLKGVYTYRLTVTDNDGATDTDDVTVTVNGKTNKSPSAKAGGNRSVTLPKNSTSLSGAASVDADGTIVSYQWQQVDGPAETNLSATNTANIDVNDLESGVYTFRLTVTDNDNATGVDEVTITVNSLPNEAPIANAGTNLVITLPVNSASLRGSGIDADGTIAGYQWQQISGPSSSALSAANTANITVSNLQAGLYIYRLTVRDNDNATGTDNITITVNSAPPNKAPVANAGLNKVITLPANSTSLSGSASTDPDGTIASYLWQQISGPSASALSATNTATVTVSNLKVGKYTYRLTVRDNDNAAATATVTVTVNNVPNKAPIAKTGPDQVLTITANTTILTADQSSDPDGKIVSYKWQQVSGPAASTLSSASTASITISNLQPGDYVYRVTVTDDDNATDTAIVKVAVIDNFRSYDKPFALYPNPAQDIINIRLLSDKASRSQINIYDMSGKQVLDPAIVNKPAGAFTTSIDVSRLKPGTYVVYITAFGVKKMTAKFLKL